jgi:pyrimidine-nucleoside phosphorylase
VDFREVVAAKRDGAAVSDEDIRTLVLAYARGDVPDYLVAAFLMAAFIRGLDAKETVALTAAMVESGATLPLAGVSRPKLDKHSTGGVADGVTLVFAPLAAALGMAMAKLSGRGLGHTGGTLDKLEAIPGFRTDLSIDALERQVEEIGCAVAAQSRELVPADSALYALRDATATVSSIPLIAASVMSKKLVVGSDLLLLDVKAGSGAFMKTPEDADELAEACMELCAHWAREARAAITDMSQPLGEAVGNALEVTEAVQVLRGERRGWVADLAVEFAVVAQQALLHIGAEEARARAERVLDSGEAAETFRRMVEAQGGDPRVVDEPGSVLAHAPVVLPLVAPRSGYLLSVDAEAIGRIAAGLGAGRGRKEDPVDPAVGLTLAVKIGDTVERGEEMGHVHARDGDAARAAAGRVSSTLTWSEMPIQPPPLVYRWRDSAHG